MAPVFSEAITLLTALFSISVSSPLCQNGGKYYDEFQACIRAQPDALSFLDAEADCVSMGGHLPSVHNAFQNALLVSLSQTHLNYEQIWIGLRKSDYVNWQWSDGTNFDYAKWINDDPQESITYLDPKNNGFWESLPWTDYTMKPFLCEIPIGHPVFNNSTSTTTSTTTTTTTTTTPTTTTTATTTTTTTTRQPWERCPPNFVYNYATRACYYANLYNPYYIINYDQASRECAGLGSTLASIHSKDENDFVHDLIRNYDVCTYAILGGYSIDNGYNFQWQDATPFDYQNWYYKIRGANNGIVMRVGNCRKADNPGKWDAIPRQQPYHYYVCKYPVK